MGDINSELENFKNRIENKAEDKSISTYVLRFMVRGVFTSLAYLFAYYAGQGFSSDQLYPCVWKSVRVLEAINLKCCFSPVTELLQIDVFIVYVKSPIS